MSCNIIVSAFLYAFQKFTSLVDQTLFLCFTLSKGSGHYWFQFLFTDWFLENLVGDTEALGEYPNVILKWNTILQYPLLLHNGCLYRWDMLVGYTWKNPGGTGPTGMPSPGGMFPMTGLEAAAALWEQMHNNHISLPLCCYVSLPLCVSMRTTQTWPNKNSLPQETTSSSLPSTKACCTNPTLIHPHAILSIPQFTYIRRSVLHAVTPINGFVHWFFFVCVFKSRAT